MSSVEVIDLTDDSQDRVEKRVSEAPLNGPRKRARLPDPGEVTESEGEDEDDPWMAQLARDRAELFDGCASVVALLLKRATELDLAGDVGALEAKLRHRADSELRGVVHEYMAKNNGKVEGLYAWMEARKASYQKAADRWRKWGNVQ